MIVPLKIALLSPLFVVTSGGGCLDIKPGNMAVKVDVQAAPVTYNLETPYSDFEAMREVSIDLLKAPDEDYVWMSSNLEIGSMARGGLGFGAEVKMYMMPYSELTSTYCPFVKRINVTVHYNPRIYIPDEVRPRGCEFNALIRHEMKHHELNMEFLKEKVSALTEVLSHIIVRYENAHFQLDTGSKSLAMQQSHEKMAMINALIVEDLKKYGKTIFDEMAVRSDALDNEEEYNAVKTACAPHEYRKN